MLGVGFRVEGLLGCRVWCSGFMVYGFWLMNSGFWFMVCGLWFMVSGLGSVFRASGQGFDVECLVFSVLGFGG